MGKNVSSIKEKNAIIAINSLTSDGYYGLTNEEIATRYFIEFGVFPNSMMISKKIDIKKLYEDYANKQTSVHFYEDTINDIILKFEDEKMLIHINTSGFNPNECKFKIFACFPVSKSIEDAKSFMKNITDKYIIPESNTESKVHFVTSNGGHYDLQEYEFTKPVINLTLNYGEDFQPIHDRLVSLLKEKKRSGLILFDSVPGTGKSKYIQYLTDIVSEKKFIYLNSDLFAVFDSPQFTSFALSELKDSVLILEDCEKIITSREVNANNSVISTLLNLTSGIFADVLNCKIICTFNTTKNNIDEALLRKGRLLAEHHFRKLSPSEANALYKVIHNKTDDFFKEEATLSEVYNIDEVSSSYKKEKRRIGF